MSHFSVAFYTVRYMKIFLRREMKIMSVDERRVSINLSNSVFFPGIFFLFLSEHCYGNV